MGKTLTCLLVEDDEPVRRAVRNALESEFSTFAEAKTAREAIDLAASARPHFIILDLGLPDRDGLSVCTEIRKWSNAPMIVLSARHNERDKVALLEAGADDFVTKPFSTAELRARVRANLRRAETRDESAVITANNLTIDPVARTVRRNGEPIHLTPIEWDLLRALILHAGRTMTHSQIFRAVWRSPAGDAQTYLRVHIANLRRKLESDPVRPSLIITEPGVGYRLQVD